MKSKIVMFAAAIAMSHSGLALAQSSTTSIAPPEADPAAVANTSTATSSETATVRPGIKYFGQLLGQGLDFSGTEQSNGYGDKAAFTIDNRPKFFARIGNNLEAGIEARFFTNFESTGWNLTNNNSRLFVNFKNIYKDDVFAVSFIPRAMLAQSNKAHNQKATVSPDLILSVDAAPKNSRFSFNGGLEVIKHLYSDVPTNDVKHNYLAARSLTFDPWLEVDYQLNPTVQLSASYWPDWATTRGSSHLDNDFQELDVGAYVEVAKGWQLMPYVGTNFNNFQASNALDNMQLNIALSGTVL